MRNRLSTSYGGTSRTITSTYDTLNRLSTMSEGGRVTSYHYDLNGNIASKVLPNGDTETTTYDAQNRAGTQSGATSSRTITTTYDTLNRPSTMSEGGRVTSYHYDLNSNIATKVLPNGDLEASPASALNRADFG